MKLKKKLSRAGSTAFSHAIAVTTDRISLGDLNAMTGMMCTVVEAPAWPAVAGNGTFMDRTG